MCRLFGLLGNGGSPAEPWLVDTDHSLLKQANVPGTERQTDGWGVGWYDDRGALRVEKGVGGAASPSEVDRFRAVARAAHGPLAIGHLRKASNPMGLTKERLIGFENSQPFFQGTTLFAHNGAIPFPRETRAFLGDYEKLVRGVNDSEVLFWLLQHHLDATPDPVAAFTRTVTDLGRVWREKRSPPRGPYSGLNILLSRRPDELWAFCASLGEHGPALLSRDRPYYQMAYLADAKQLVVGSEPFDGTRKDWRNLSNGHYLHAEVSHGLVGVTTGSIPAPAPVARAAR